MNAGRIVFLINAAIVGGAERHAAALVRGLRARGFAAEIVALLDEAQPLSLARRLRHLQARLQGCDVVVAVNERPAVMAALARLKRQARVVAILHSTLARNAGERALRLAHLPALYGLDEIVFVAQRQRALWRRWGLLAKSQTIRNGVDLAHFAPDPSGGRRAALGFAPGDVVASFCAALRPEKNVVHFLEALAA